MREKGREIEMREKEGRRWRGEEKVGRGEFYIIKVVLRKENIVKGEGVLLYLEKKDRE